MKTENLLLVGVAAIVGYKLFAGNQQKLSFLPDTLFEQDTSVQTPSTTTTTSTPTTASFPLKRGSKGDYVKKLQQYLGVTADGIFGPVTESALYQRHGIKQVDSLAKLTALLATAAQAQKPAQTTTSTPVTTNNTPATVTVSDAEYVAVFNAVYEKVTMGGQPVIRVRSVIDVDGILNVLGKKTDAQLKAWNAEFNRRYAKILIWQNYSTPTTLYNTLNHISFIRRSVTVSALINRVKALI